jgi:hypothetical protein
VTCKFTEGKPPVLFEQLKHFCQHYAATFILRDISFRLT